MDTAAPAPLVYSLREEQGVYIGERQMFVLAIGEGQAEIELGMRKVTVYAGEKISLGVGNLFVEKFSDDGKRRLVLRVEAPREAAHGVLSRGESPARATG